jgi:hypothetical protein
VARWIDEDDGTIVLDDGLRVDASWDHRRFAGSPLSRGAIRQADWFRPRATLVDGRLTELWMCFRGRLQELRLRHHVGDGRPPDSVAARGRDFRHWTWLLEGLGAPTYHSQGGVLYAYDWGWVHAGRGSIHVSYPLAVPAVPLPDGDGERGAYRCMRCAAVEVLPYGQVVEVPRTRGGAPCGSCGEVAWVRVGTEAERQRISARPDYCEVGRHMTKGVRTHRLIAKADRPLGDGRHLETRRVRACEHHRAVLLAGFYGFILPSAE